MKGKINQQEEKPLASFGTDLAVRLVYLFTFIFALILAFQPSIIGLFNSFGILGQIGLLFLVLILVMGVLNSIRQLNEALLYRKAAKVSGTYWRGQPRCPFLVVKNNFRCEITPTDPIPLEVIGKCHVKSRWKACWENEKLSVMSELLDSEEKDPGVHARLAWQWGTMGPEFGTCDQLLKMLKNARKELETLEVNEEALLEEKTKTLLIKRWKNALSVGMWAAERCECTEEPFVKEIITIASKYSSIDDKIHQRILLYFNQGGRKGSKFLIEHVQDNWEALSSDELFNFLYYIGYSQNEDAIPLLQKLVLVHESIDVKTQAAYMLVEIKKLSAIKALLSILEETDDEEITAIIKEALKSVKYDGLHHLIALLEDDSLIQESYNLLLEVLEKDIPDVEYKIHAKWLLKKKEGMAKLEEEINILKEHSFPEHVIYPLKVALDSKVK